MVRKIKRPSTLGRGTFVHRRPYFAGSTAGEHAYFNRRGERIATYHNSPTSFPVSKGAYFQGVRS